MESAFTLTALPFHESAQSHHDKHPAQDEDAHKGEEHQESPADPFGGGRLGSVCDMSLS